MNKKSHILPMVLDRMNPQVEDTLTPRPVPTPSPVPSPVPGPTTNPTPVPDGSPKTGDNTDLWLWHRDLHTKEAKTIRAFIRPTSENRKEEK